MSDISGQLRNPGSISVSIKLEDKPLLQLKHSDVESANTSLLDSLSSKATNIDICIESEHVSNEALSKIIAKP
jgi:hypothetical protein